MTARRAIQVELTPQEVAEVGRALSATDRDLAKALEEYGAQGERSALPWSVLDAWRMRRTRLAAVLEKLERAAGCPLRELGL